MDEEIQARLREMFPLSRLREIDDRVIMMCRAPFKLDTDEGVSWLASLVGDTHPDVILIDALSDVKGAARENDNDEMGAAMRRVRDLVARPFNCAVILSDHMGRPREDGTMNARGASAKEDVAADIIHLEKKEDRSVGSFEKVRHRSRPDPFSFAIVKDEDTGLLDIAIEVDRVGALNSATLIRKMEAELGIRRTISVAEMSDQLGVTEAIVRKWAKEGEELGLLRIRKSQISRWAEDTPTEGKLF